MSVSYSARGNPSYSIEMWHDGLNKHRVIKGPDSSIIEQKVRLQLSEWADRWTLHTAKEQERSQRSQYKSEQERNKQKALDLTAEATSELDSLSQLLKATLKVNDAIQWDALKDARPFPERSPEVPKAPPEPTVLPQPRKPILTDVKYQPKLGLLDRLIPGRRAQRVQEARNALDVDLSAWVRVCKEVEDRNAQARSLHESLLAKNAKKHAEALHEWEHRRLEYQEKQALANAKTDKHRDDYLAAVPEAIEEYCDLVLSSSQYPHLLPQEYELQYIATSQTLIVDYQLPAPESMPTLKAVRYVAARQAFEEAHITEAQKTKLYDDVLYQVALRTIHEVFESDSIGAIDAVAFNGIVTALDRTTGKPVTACILSLRAGKNEFNQINLSLVDPKACFKALKGVGSAKLSGLSAVAPVMPLQREDKRFVDSYGVAGDLDDSDNLAAMDWQDFEHLIRELFEKEFSTSGGEVRVTQASRDGGVDAVAFDPDPIRGGKIVIQAKRYINTVSVSAVRDLYGTVMAEGATKGVLVTTADYGPDAYAFANGKPLVLLNGSNLLHLLAKHGHKAKIDIREARIAAR
ncbi:restriction endonuclease [uncultured Hydrogenophaga sp.]|uniref:restriction endonuclease n=1 Tax=uncultured Hydrogenophaga sp. TaxID=199683 RepID=UPI00258EC24D|nr:restriction endonuclease [uncultured Hydrogenophaga sp.]